MWQSYQWNSCACTKGPGPVKLIERVAKILGKLYVSRPLMMFPWSSAFNPSSPLTKVASSTAPCSKIGRTTLKGKGEGGGGGRGCVLYLRFFSSNDCRKEKLFLIRRVSTILQLVVACLSHTYGNRACFCKIAGFGLTMWGLLAQFDVSTCQLWI